MADVYKYPTDLFEQPYDFREHLGSAASEALEVLERRYDNNLSADRPLFTVQLGLTEYYAGSISVMAMQPHIRANCPRDETEERFATHESTLEWLKKSKAVFLLTELVGKTFESGQRLAGYGWTAPKTIPEVPDGETTFAIRIGQDYRGQRLAAGFGHLMIAASAELFGAQNFWLETDESNRAAVEAYEALGFYEVDYQPRPYTKRRPKIEPRLDRRLYMRLPDDKLATLR